MSRWMKLIGSMFLAVALGLPAAASANDAADAKAKVEAANAVMTEIMAAPDKGIPHDLLKNAKAIAIFPGVVKAGFILGGKYGRGVLIRHVGNSWSAPAFFSIGAGSIGWQIGASSTDLVLLIRSERGLESFMKNEFSLGADASIAAGPVGRDASAATDVALKAEILSYSRSRGLFAGLSLEGAKINILDDYAKAYYGKKLTPRQILFEGKGSMKTEAKKLAATINKYSK
ncbi:MAG TPA: lipid-binding SYLF domain-containing protein [Mariprofundaceae bacterium]|nr:lipid-binding SYLF domain-containing protein [Mariprofundaceae bacterium]